MSKIKSRKQRYLEIIYKLEELINKAFMEEMKRLEYAINAKHGNYTDILNEQYNYYSGLYNQYKERNKELGIEV